MYNINTLCHKILQPYLNNKTIAIDATSGNGNDTLFLCKSASFVYAFDIQKQAMNNTIDRLDGYHNYKFILDGHQNMSKYVNKADIIMFNFGYLPHSDKEIVSTVNTSMTAIKEAITILNKGGIMSICLYPGHSEGLIETKSIVLYICSLPYYYQIMQSKKDGPILVIIYK